MNLGIVGPDSKAFSPEMQEAARVYLRSRIVQLYPPEDRVLSGGCPFGGIDAWAIEEAKRAGVPFHEFVPATNDWEHGYKPRNILIAKESDLLLCVTVKTLPNGKTRYCPHCMTSTHVTSGGCWTRKEALRRGKRVELHVLGA